MNEEEIYADFDSANIAFERFEHAPVFTVEDSAAIHEALIAAHTKNLFLKDKHKRYWLIVLPSDRRADLRGIAAVVGAGKLSFGKQEDMLRLLHVEPGAVTPLAAVNAPAGSIEVVFDKSFRSHDRIAIHPLRNTATIAVGFEQMLHWLTANGVQVKVETLP